MPMPALNIIATQDTVLNSGSSSSPPSVMRPYLLKATHSTNTTSPEATSTNAQPRLCMVALSSLLDTPCSEPVATAPQTMKTRVRTAATPNTTQSVRGGRAASRPSELGMGTPVIRTPRAPLVSRSGSGKQP
ncbi:hypothetical protein GCM10020001_040380 [Nonomuraea salmonea]